jgi:hypothetical protein
MDATTASREPVTTLILSRGGKVRQQQLVRSTPAWEAFTREAAALRKRMDPQGLVVMTARRKESVLHVRFTLLGERPVTILLSPDAEESFRIPGRKVNYRTEPKELEVVLSPQRRSASVSLLVPGGTTSTELHYFNSVLLHHASGDRTLDGSVPDLALCAAF